MSETVGTGRHLTALQLQAWTGFLDAARMLDDVLGRHLVVDHDLSHREYEVLVRLDGHGGRMRMSLLAEQIVASPALVTQTIARLEARELATREAVASGDGRGVEAVITALGRATLKSAATGHAAIVVELLLERIGPDHLQSFAGAVDDVAAHLRSHRHGEACERPECPALRYA